MIAHAPSNARPSGLPSGRSLAIGQALDRLAYASVWVFVFDLPWGENVPMMAGFVLGSWLGFLVAGIGALRTMTLQRARKPSPFHYLMMALAGWSALSVLWTQDWGTTVSRGATYLQLLVIVWLIWELAVTQARVIGLLQAYVFGALLASGLTIYNFMMGYTVAQQAAALGKIEWETSRYSIYGINANDLGLILALSVPIIFYLLVSSRGRLVKLLCWVQLVAGFTAIMLTGSRGSVVAATAGLAMFPLTTRWQSRSQRFISAIAGVGLLACGAYFVPQSSWLRIFEFGSELSEGTLTHRTVLWAAGLDAFRIHPFLGVGSGAYGFTILRVADFSYKTGSAANAVAHNTFLSVLVELGVVGALLLFLLLATMLYCAIRMRYLERCLWISLLLTWTIGVSALTWEYRKPTWLLFSLLAAHVYSRRETEQIAHMS
jgi:O-antigen ligase